MKVMNLPKPYETGTHWKTHEEIFSMIQLFYDLGHTMYQGK
jgi:hypothetical protein